MKINLNKEINDILLNPKRNGEIKSKDEIQKIVSDGLTLKGNEIQSNHKYWENHIPMKDLLMGFRVSGGCFVFSSSEFSVSSGIKNITNVFSISDFTRIKVVRGGILSDNIELDGKVIGKFNRRSIDPWNQIFDEINTVFETYFEKTLEQREIEEVVEEERLKDEEKEKKEETYLSGDTEFILKAAGPNKLKVVVLIKEMTGWELAEAKAAMDAAPTTLAVDLTEFDAETYLFLFEEEGAEVEILTKSQREELDFFKNINKRIDLVDTALKKISVLVIPSIAEYKSNVVEHEDVISKKAGDNQLYSFLKVYSFLNEFRNRIRVDQSELSNGIDVEQIKYKCCFYLNTFLVKKIYSHVLLYQTNYSLFE